ncbi:MULTISPECIES: PhoH family protein [Inquilinus]|uniref:PhoH-like protein n=1 Tax=Inquilinus ginsengisoli TaxID=363840 RepID=A0ABU1JYM5_9PROT|nr:PhoH family protein [Inquilinus ginsengisoli]MDR6293732.1 phosphate starvation-inducible PhoH-like protein [Inquilinus ginsengisoli]
MTARESGTMVSPKSKPAPHRVDVSFDDNRLLPLLYGEHDTHLLRIEHQLGVSLASRGNTVTIKGATEPVEQARLVLETLWQRLAQGQGASGADIDGVIRMVRDAPPLPDGAPRGLPQADGAIVTRRKRIGPRSPTQAEYIAALGESEMVFGVGPAGTGKTYLAVAQAVSLLIAGRVDRIVLSRPAVEAGERLGFLPGDLKEKVDPYLRPLYDALYDLLPAEQVAKHIETGTIEIAPLAFMRGRTLAHSFVILDEAQNTTVMQMRMALTRMGEASRMVITGDTSQIDLKPGDKSGLVDALEILDGTEGIRVVRFTDRDVVRHPLVARIVRAYEAADRARKPQP